MAKDMLALILGALSLFKACSVLHDAFGLILAVQFALAAALAAVLWIQKKRRAGAIWLLTAAVLLNLYTVLNQPDPKLALMLLVATSMVLVIEVVSHD